MIQHFEIKLSIVGPLLCKGLGAAALGVDASTFVYHDCLAIPCLAIPGSHLKGHLLECMRRLIAAGCTSFDERDLVRWFGAAPAREASLEPGRGALMWPFVFKGPANAHSKRFRVQIDAQTGASSDQALLQLESGLAAGAVGTFVGTVHAVFDDVSAAARCETALRLALALLDAVGSLKGVGFGRVQSASVSMIKAPAMIKAQATSLPITAISDCLELRFQLDRPFCFGEREGRSSSLVSKDYVPGAAILGALFRAAKRDLTDTDAQLLLKHSELLRCSHAYVLNENARQAPLPLTWVLCDGKLHDVIDKTPLDFAAQAPQFSVDWKDKDRRQVNAALSRKYLERMLLVRTAIENGSAKDAQLFAYDCVDPKQHRFAARLSIDAAKLKAAEIKADEAKLLAQALARYLPNAMSGLGKTDACAASIALQWQAAPPELECTGKVYVQLLSEAWTDLDLSNVPASNGQEQLLAAYRKHFVAINAPGLTLSHFFARQRYDGGDYLHRRFRNGEPYRPWLITEAGSVFAFEVTGAEQAKQTLAHWRQDGLPTRDPDDWQRNPYRRQNGYGEVAISNQPAVCVELKTTAEQSQ